MAGAVGGRRHLEKAGRVVLKVCFTDPWGSQDLSGASVRSNLFYCVNICSPAGKAMMEPLLPVKAGALN